MSAVRTLYLLNFCYTRGSCLSTFHDCHVLVQACSTGEEWWTGQWTGEIFKQVSYMIVFILPIKRQQTTYTHR